MFLSELIDRSGVQHARLSADADVGSLGDVDTQESDSLVFAESQKYLETAMANPHVKCIVTTAELVGTRELPCAVLLTDEPRWAFFAIHNHLASCTDFYGKDFPAEVSPEARVHPTAVLPGKNVRIGPGTVIGPHVTIHERTIIGAQTTVRAGASVGCEGFQYVRSARGILPVRHAGGVRIGDRVEIHSNAVIDAALFAGFTEIGDDTKIDNLVHIAHAVRIGKRCFIVAGSSIGGTTQVGDDCWIGPNAVLATHISIGAGSKVAIGSVVIRSVPPGVTVFGNPARITQQHRDADPAPARGADSTRG